MSRINKAFSTASIILIAITLGACVRQKLEPQRITLQNLAPPRITLGNENMSPAQLRTNIDPGARMGRVEPGLTAYYSVDGSYPTHRYDPTHPPVFFDNVLVKVVEKKMRIYR